VVDPSPRSDAALVEDRRLPVLMGGLLKQVSLAVLEADLDGLRASHLRLLAALPAEGLTITELSTRLGMTKQGCGQHVTHLVRTGHLHVGVSATDRRARTVRCTPQGHQAAAAFDDVVAAVERRWAATLGEADYGLLCASMAALLRL
jgi:DNA-binding MarR family transcriptional regulator